MRTLVVCSGGLDSVTLSHRIAVEDTIIDDPTTYDDADYWLEARRAYLAKHPA